MSISLMIGSDKTSTRMFATILLVWVVGSITITFHCKN